MKKKGFVSFTSLIFIILLIMILGYIFSPPDYVYVQDEEILKEFYNAGETCTEFQEDGVWKKVKTEEQCHGIDVFTIRYLVFFVEPDGTPDCQWVTYDEHYCNNRFAIRY